MKVPDKSSGKPINKKKKPHTPSPQVDRRQPPPQRRQTAKTKRRKKNYTVYYIFFAVVIGVVLLILANTILFNVSQITVEGETSYTAEQIIEASGLKQGQNLLHINADNAAKQIMSKLILVDNVKVKKQFPNGIKVELSPAERFANVELEGKYCVISYGDKILIESAPSADAKIPIIRGYEPDALTEGGIIKSTDEAKTKLVHEIYDGLYAADLWDKTTEIDITDRFSISIVYDSRVTLELGTSTELGGKLYIAKELISAKIGSSERVKVLLQDTEKVYVQDDYAHQTLPPADPTTEELTQDSSDGTGEETHEEAPETSSQE